MAAPAYKTEIKTKNRKVSICPAARFLRLQWDSKLTWAEHIAKLKLRCAKDLNLLRSLTSCTWRADQETVMRLYRAIVRPKLDYGSIVYGAASQTLLKQVEAIPNEAFWISWSSFKTTLIINLQIFLNKRLLELRRQELLLRYFFKIKCYIQNPAYYSLINTSLRNFFSNRNYTFIIMRLHKILAEYNISAQHILHRRNITIEYNIYIYNISAQHILHRRNILGIYGWTDGGD